MMLSGPNRGTSLPQGNLVITHNLQVITLNEELIFFFHHLNSHFWLQLLVARMVMVTV